jgi:hypothetical protein
VAIEFSATQVMNRRQRIVVWLRTCWLVLLRRLSLAVKRDFDPYPARPTDLSFDPSAAFAREEAGRVQALAWRGSSAEDLAAWQKDARRKLGDLIGYDGDTMTPSVYRSSPPLKDGEFRRQRIILRLDESTGLPIHLIWRGERDECRAVMLCMTGTNVGVHCAWGEALHPADVLKIANGLDIARQAAERGYLAIAIEQMGLGERTERSLSPTSHVRGVDAVHHALLLGRTLLGFWASDVARVIDWLKSPDSPAGSKAIYALGHSAGGTTALFSAAFDTRIDGIIASGCIGSWRRNLMRRRDETGQLAIPGILSWFEMADILALVAPRPLVAASGREDHIWPFVEMQRVVGEASSAYAAMNQTDHLVVVEGPFKHRFYVTRTWAAWENIPVSGER